MPQVRDDAQMGVCCEKGRKFGLVSCIDVIYMMCGEWLSADSHSFVLCKVTKSVLKTSRRMAEMFGLYRSGRRGYEKQR